MGYIAETDDDAKKEFFPSLKAHHDILGRERGWPSFDENMFEREVGSQGAIYLGSPETVAQKLLKLLKR